MAAVASDAGLRQRVGGTDASIARVPEALERIAAKSVPLTSSAVPAAFGFGLGVSSILYIISSALIVTHRDVTYSKNGGSNWVRFAASLVFIAGGLIAPLMARRTEVVGPSRGGGLRTIAGVWWPTLVLATGILFGVSGVACNKVCSQHTPLSSHTLTHAHRVDTLLCLQLSDMMRLYEHGHKVLPLLFVRASKFWTLGTLCACTAVFLKTVHDLPIITDALIAMHIPGVADFPGARDRSYQSWNPLRALLLLVGNALILVAPTIASLFIALRGDWPFGANVLYIVCKSLFCAGGFLTAAVHLLPQKAARGAAAVTTAT